MGRLAMGRLALALAAGALVVGASACGERSEPTGPASELYPVTVSVSGDRPLVLHRPARRIAVIAPSVRSLIVALGGRHLIVGAPVSPNGTVSVGALRALRPDLVVASSATDGRELERAAKAVGGTPIYVAPDDSIRGVERAIAQLGLIMGEPAAARGLVHQIESRRQLVNARLAGKQPVSVFLDTGFFTTVSDQSLIGDLLREARATNIAGGTPQVEPFDLGDLALANPSFYLATSDSGTTLAGLRRNRRTRKLDAISRDRFAIVDASLLAPGPAVGQAIVELARLLHPDAFR